MRHNGIFKWVFDFFRCVPVVGVHSPQSVVLRVAHDERSARSEVHAETFIETSVVPSPIHKPILSASGDRCYDAIGRYLANRVFLYHIDGTVRCGQGEVRFIQSCCCGWPILTKSIASASQRGCGAVRRYNSNSMVRQIGHQEVPLAVESDITARVRLRDIRVPILKPRLATPGVSPHNSIAKLADMMIPCVSYIQHAGTRPFGSLNRAVSRSVPARALPSKRARFARVIRVFARVIIFAGDVRHGTVRQPRRHRHVRTTRRLQ